MRNLARLGGIAALFLSSAFVSAGDLPMVEHVDGRPENFDKGDRACYAVWHTPGEGWHVDVTTAGHRHHFKGRVWIEGEGKFGEVKEWKGEGEKRAEQKEWNWFHKAIKRGEKDREISFDIVSEGGVSGVFFNVEGAGPLKWELGIGGASDKDPVKHEPGHVKIGHKGQNPPEVPFQTFSHPDKRGHGH